MSARKAITNGISKWINHNNPKEVITDIQESITATSKDLLSSDDVRQSEIGIEHGSLTTFESGGNNHERRPNKPDVVDKKSSPTQPPQKPAAKYTNEINNTYLWYTDGARKDAIEITR